MEQIHFTESVRSSNKVYVNQPPANLIIKKLGLAGILTLRLV